MLSKHFTKILYATGALTLLPIAFFFVPWSMFSLLDLTVGNNSGVLFVKHWGLMAFCFGGLLIYAAMHPEARRAIVIAAAVEKLGLCVIIAVGWNDPGYAPMRPTLFIDGLMVLIFGLYLISGGDREARLAEQRR
jgi:hypothetical protein